MRILLLVPGLIFPALRDTNLAFTNTFRSVPVFETVDRIGLGLVNSLFPPQRAGTISEFSKIAVSAVPHSDLECTIFFGLDKARPAFMILHQETFDSSPRSFICVGVVGGEPNQYRNPTDFAVVARPVGARPMSIDDRQAADYIVYVSDTGNGRVKKMIYSTHHPGARDAFECDTAELMPASGVVPASITTFEREMAAPGNPAVAVRDLMHNRIVIYREGVGILATISPQDLGDPLLTFGELQGWIVDGTPCLAVATSSSAGWILYILQFSGASYDGFSVRDRAEVGQVVDLTYDDSIGLVVLTKDGRCIHYTNNHEFLTTIIEGRVLSIAAIRQHIYISSPFIGARDGGIARYVDGVGTSVLAPAAQR